jgi:hypothetical protein
VAETLGASKDFLQNTKNTNYNGKNWLIVDFIKMEDCESKDTVLLGANGSSL